MITVKNLFDPVEESDGQRLWIESHGLTTDLQEWCRVDAVASQFGPPPKLAAWYDDHPQGYDHFRGKYHAALASCCSSGRNRLSDSAAWYFPRKYS